MILLISTTEHQINEPSSNQAIFYNTSNKGGGGLLLQPLPWIFQTEPPYEIDFGINR